MAEKFNHRGRGARPLIDLVHVVRLFAEDCKKPKVVCFRPLAAVLNEPAVEKLRAARHEFRWSNEAELVARKHEGWCLVLGCDSNNKELPAIFMDRKEELVLLHRRSRDSKAGISIKYNLSHPA
jgi:hypothetical protein